MGMKSRIRRTYFDGWREERETWIQCWGAALHRAKSECCKLAVEDVARRRLDILYGGGFPSEGDDLPLHLRIMAAELEARAKRRGE